MAEKNRISIDFRKIRMLYYNSISAPNGSVKPFLPISQKNFPGVKRPGTCAFVLPILPVRAFRGSAGGARQGEGDAVHLDRGVLRRVDGPEQLEHGLFARGKT